MRRGFASIGLLRPKNAVNVGSVLRAAGCYEASMVAVEGSRTKIKSCTDTQKAWRHIPVVRTNDLKAVIPFGAVPIAVDLLDDAECLPDFKHPHAAFYIFGPEDGTLGERTLSWCPFRVQIPTRFCMNLAATVNVVLYDRMVKTQ